MTGSGWFQTVPGTGGSLVPPYKGGEPEPGYRRSEPSEPVTARMRKRQTTSPLPAIVIDSREQQPLSFPAEVPVVVAGLASGDYSLEGYEDRIALERKSLSDLLACVGRERERFERELVRLWALDYAALVIEATLEEVLAGRPDRTLVSGRAAVGSLLAWSVDYRLPVFFCGDRRLAAALVLKVLRKWFKTFVAEPAGLRGRSKL